MYAGEVPRFVGAGECISCPTVEGRRQVVTALSILRNPPRLAMV
jgi:hypothetical protein